MKTWTRYPRLYEINTWVWLNTLSEKYKKAITLKNIPLEELIAIRDLGFDGIWLMGVWQRSPGATKIAREIPILQKEYRHALPGYTTEDIVGSPYAIYDYSVDSTLGNDEDLQILHKHLNHMEMNLILDFVPNHMAVDHPWTKKHPDFLMRGEESDIKENPGHYFQLKEGGAIFAHGKEMFYCWTDTVQIDYRNPDTRNAMIQILSYLVDLCDGVRCDMAMLELNDVFTQIWGGNITGPEFWEEAINEIKAIKKDFLFIGEVYWNKEYRMQQLGFDFIYDKILYDRVLGDNPRAVYEHLAGGSFEFQSKLLRFTENHDEKRVLNYAGSEQNRTAAVITYTAPGMKLFHDGQLEGFQVKLPVQLGRRMKEDTQPEIFNFYAQLLRVLKNPLFQVGKWQILETYMTAPGNYSYANYTAFIWHIDQEALIVAANLSSTSSQCFLPLNLSWLTEGQWLLKDLMNDFRYEREGYSLIDPGLYLDLSGYGFHIFKLEAAS